jgi:hypothetical protein
VQFNLGIQVKERGLPANIRSDNGVPFASAHALFNLSELAVWWLRLGIGIERIKPGHPQQNGRHERMHLTLKKETTKPAGLNFLQQQARFDDFIEIFNEQCPHEALDMKRPAEVYQPFTRPYKGCRYRLSFPRQDHRRHPMRSHLSGPAKKLISARSLPARLSASKKFTTIFG